MAGKKARETQATSTRAPRSIDSASDNLERRREAREGERVIGGLRS